MIEYIEPPKGLLDDVRGLISKGKVNPRDLAHATMLLRDPEHLQKTNVNWLQSLVNRGGRPYQKES